MSQSSAITIYPYKPKKLIMVICFIFFGLATGFLGNVALTNDRGLQLILVRNIVEFPFSPPEAALFYWGLTVLSCVFSLFGLFGLYKAFASKAQIVLTNEGINIPGNVFKTSTQTIPFNEILSLELVTVNRNRFLKITHLKGKVHLNESLLPEKTMFDEILNTLLNRTKIAP